MCASTSLFSIANKEPAAFISFQEIHNSFDVFLRFWGETFVPYCLIDFFPRFVYPVGSFVVLRTEGKLCSIKIRLLARTILLLCALSYAELDMIMPCLQGHRGELCQFILYEKQAYHELYISKFYYHVEGK